MSALLAAAGWSGVVTLVLLPVSRFWRRDDGALWHAIWVAVAASSAALPLANAVLPNPIAALVTDGPATRAVAGWMAAVSVSSWLLYAYVAGVTWALFKLVSGVLLVGRLVRHSEAVDGILLQRLRQSVDVPAGIVRSHRRLQVPITAGFVRPIVLLPETWIAWETDRLTVVLRHELAHIERGDYRWNLLALAFEAMFWFSPLARVVSRRIRLSAELASDRSAADRMDRVSYARVLVQSARELLSERRRGILAPGATTSLEARIAALTSRPEPVPASSRRVRLLAAAAVLTLLLSSAFVRVSLIPGARFGADHRAEHTATHGAAFRH